MKIILKQDVENLGEANDLVTVKDGYARNYLIPKGLAIVATASAEKMLNETLKQRAHKLEKIKAEAEAMAEKLAGTTIQIGAKAGENGKIFGSVNTIQVAEGLQKAGFEIDRKNITIKEEPIKSLGKYTAEVKLHRDVTQTLTFEVIEE
ncbi:MAG: 50S ribosomal protein L9 [Cryomorphaceae bacterium]|nr:MAG: 50S ribosomal protein L9 [Cryomorphaceae bacterium]